MDCYKKNPEIEGNITVQGKLLTDDTVVCGEEFKPFADPKTFPGKPVKLIKVEYQDIDTKQKKDVADLVKEQANKPPKHLGVIRSENISATENGEVQVAKPVPDVPELEAEKAKEKEKTDDAPGKKQEVLIRDKYSEQDLLDLLPGVTDSNVARVLKYSTTLDAVVNASNTALRKMGIAPGYFGRLRDKAKSLVEEEE